jgi:diguanylate cyclase (GGDEF)-like protein/PAS domain S-box-containing protein
MLIHPSHQPEARRALRGIAASLAVLCLFLLLPAPFGQGEVVAYLPLHMALETVSIVVSGLVFAVVWSVRNEYPARNYLLLGLAFLGVALLDFSHMLSVRGMPAFVTAASSDKAIYFWLAARALGALALLAAAWLPWGPTATRGQFRAGLLAVLALVAALHGLYFLDPGLLPRFFLPGQGLTRVKVAAEYALIAACLLTAVRLGWCLHRPRQFHASGLFAATCILAMSGVPFAGYASVSDGTILFGHVYKALACVFLYGAVFAETVRRPYALLRDSRQHLQATLEALPDLLFELDAQGRYLDVHASDDRGLLADREQLLGRTVAELMPPRESEVVMQALAEAREQGISRGKLIVLDVPAGRRWFELSVAGKPAQDGQPPCYVVISRDVTRQHEAQKDLRMLSMAVSQSPVSIIVTDVDGRIEFVNPAFERRMGYQAAEVIGKDSRELLWTGKTAEATWRELRECMVHGRPWQGEFVNRCKSGREVVEMVLIYPLRNEQGEVTHYLAHHEDITEKKRAAERIQQLAHYDQLTGLPNRAMLPEHFRYARTRGNLLALLWIDLDRFKDINDTLGHDAGDLLLQEMSRRLLAGIGDGLLSRHSGDEFVAILPDTSQEAVARLMQGLLPALAQSVVVAGQELFTTVSVGVALCPEDADRLDELLKNAEIAMYRAKENGRNACCFYAPEMQALTTRTLALGNALKQAWQRGELHLAYQPQVALADGRIVGAEALLRWNSPQWGSVSPAEFIPIAEANGLIVPIGEWVLRTALVQMRDWLDRGLPAMSMAVNLSAAQFSQSDLVERIGRLLDETGAPPECLELELTEAVAMKAPGMVVQKLDELGLRRIRLAIDDFGTGYSSLSYLKRFRINKIKIDQSFVRDITVDPDDQAIVVAIIQMAHGLGMGTIAEGVETAEQLNFLRRRGCEEAQGYYFSRPLPAAEFERFVRERRGIPSAAQRR